MKILKISLMVIGLLILVIVGFMWYAGFFSNITIQEKQIGGYKVAGVEFVGPYSKVGPSMIKADNDLKAMGIICARSFGIYRDNPQTTPKEKCRSFVGDVLEEKDYGKIDSIKSKGLLVDSIPLAQSLVIKFTLKNTISYMIGPMKAYPAFTKYMNEKGFVPALSYEVYDTKNKVIYYVMQIKKK